MATTLYLESTTYPLTPSSLGGIWHNTSQAGHYLTNSTKTSSAFVQKFFTDPYTFDYYTLVGQWNSPPMDEGQLLENFQAISCVIQLREVDAGCNLFMRWGVYVYDSTGTIQRKVIVPQRLDNLELAVGTLTSRIDSTVQSGAYTTQAGDFLSIEIGISGVPNNSNGHTGSIEVGSNSSTNLSTDNQTSTFNPIITIEDNISFLPLPSNSPSISPSGSFSPSSSPSGSTSSSVSSSPSMSLSPSSSYSESPSISLSSSVSKSQSPSSSHSASISPSVPAASVFYLESSLYPTITPTPVGWTDTSQFSRYLANTTKANSVMTTINITDSLTTQADIIAGQWISHSLDAGQTIHGSQDISLIIRASETTSTNNLFVSWGAYIYNGNTLKKTLVAKRNDITEVDVGVLASRLDSITSTAGDYVTDEQDRFVFEIGLEGDPTSGTFHNGSLSAGSDSAFDLNNDGIAFAYNPIVLFSLDTFTFNTISASPSVSASISPSISKSSSTSNSVSPSLSPSLSLSISPSSSVSKSKSSSLSPSSSFSQSRSISPSVSPSLSRSVSPSVSPSISISTSPSASISKSASISPSASATLSPSASISPSRSVSYSASISLSTSSSPSISPSSSESVSPSPSSPIAIKYGLFIQAS